MPTRMPSPIERTALVLDAATAAYAEVRQREVDPVFVGVEWLAAGLVRVRSGEKVLRGDAGEIHVRAGDLVWIPSGTRLDVRNFPAGDGEFFAEGLLIAPELLLRAAPRPTASGAHVRRLDAGQVPQLAEAHGRCIEAIAQGYPASVVNARVAEALAWLGELRIDVSVSSSVRLGVKRLVSGDPSRAWTLAEVARALAMSEDTLHRRLASEATAFSKLLTAIRMDQAVSLLWTTDLPVGHVAREVGYTSASRFAARFRERFGILPSQLRAGGGVLEGEALPRPGSSPR